MAIAKFNSFNIMGKNDLTASNQFGTDWIFDDGNFGRCALATGTNLNAQNYDNANYQMPIGSDFAVSCWIDNGFRIGFEHSQGSNEITINNVLHLKNASNKTQFKFDSALSLYSGSSSSYDSNSSSSSIDTVADGTLKHIVIQRIYSGNTLQSEFYIDGILTSTLSSNSALVAGMTQNANNLTLSILANSVNFSRVPSKLDQLRIYHRTLSASEIQQLANET